MSGTPSPGTSWTQPSLPDALGELDDGLPLKAVITELRRSWAGGSPASGAELRGAMERAQAQLERPLLSLGDYAVAVGFLGSLLGILLQAVATGTSSHELGGFLLGLVFAVTTTIQGLAVRGVIQVYAERLRQEGDEGIEACLEVLHTRVLPWLKEAQRPIIDLSDELARRAEELKAIFRGVHEGLVKAVAEAVAEGNQSFRAGVRASLVQVLNSGVSQPLTTQMGVLKDAIGEARASIDNAATRIERSGNIIGGSVEEAARVLQEAMAGPRSLKAELDVVLRAVETVASNTEFIASGAQEAAVASQDAAQSFVATAMLLRHSKQLLSEDIARKQASMVEADALLRQVTGVLDQEARALGAQHLQGTQHLSAAEQVLQHYRELSGQTHREVQALLSRTDGAAGQFREVASFVADQLHRLGEASQRLEQDAALSRQSSNHIQEASQVALSVAQQTMQSASRIDAVASRIESAASQPNSPLGGEES